MSLCLTHARRTFEGREAAIEQQFEVTKLALAKDNGWERLCFGGELCVSWEIAGE